MSAALFALLAVMLAGVGARDQVTVAHMAARLGARPAFLVTAIMVGLVSAALAAAAAVVVAPELSSRARMILAAMALAVAGLESLVITPSRKPEEPTRSLGALAVVLFAHQLTDAARFLAFAIAVALAAPISAGIGAAAGGAVTVTAAWLAPELADAPKLRLVRRTIGAAMLVLAAVMVLRTW